MPAKHATMYKRFYKKVILIIFFNMLNDSNFIYLFFAAHPNKHQEPQFLPKPVKEPSQEACRSLPAPKF